MRTVVLFFSQPLLFSLLTPCLEFMPPWLSMHLCHFFFLPWVLFFDFFPWDGGMRWSDGSQSHSFVFVLCPPHPPPFVHAFFGPWEERKTKRTSSDHILVFSFVHEWNVSRRIEHRLSLVFRGAIRITFFLSSFLLAN